jgi:hypothetical protein
MGPKDDPSNVPSDRIAVGASPPPPPAPQPSATEATLPGGAAGPVHAGPEHAVRLPSKPHQSGTVEPPWKPDDQVEPWATAGDRWLQDDDHELPPLTKLDEPGWSTTLPNESFVFGAGARGGPSLGRTLLTIGSVIALAAGALVFWFSRAGGGGVALAIEMHAGPPVAYVMALTMNGTLSIAGNSQDVTGGLDARVSWRVTSVDPDGIAEVQLTMSKISAHSEGKTSKIAGPITVEVKIAPDGRILSGTDLSALGDFAGGLPGGSQFVPVLPDHPVKPGDTWSMGYRQTNTVGYGSVDISATGTLVDVSSTDGRKIATVQTHETVPVNVTFDLAKLARAFGEDGVPAGAKMTYSGQIDVIEYSWVDVDAKQLIKSSADSRFHLDMTAEGLGPSIPNGTTLTFDGSMGLDMAQVNAPAGLSV